MVIKVDLSPTLRNLSLKEFLIKSLKMFILQALIFYLMYPDALNIRDSSILVYGGVTGILLYAYNRFPFKELSRLLFFFMLILVCAWIAEQLNQTFEGFIVALTRTQMGFLFTAYLIIFIFHNVHKTYRVEYLVGYMAMAVLLQCIITLLMSKMPEVNDFFIQYTNKNTGYEAKRDHYEKMRLVGYGSALFGGGMIAGLGLIMQGFLIVRLSLNKWQFILAIIAYCFTFFIGLFTARTAIVGCSLSIILMILLSFMDKKVKKVQLKNFFIIGIFFFIVGAILCTIYFPQYTDWAFEMWYTYQKTGSFSTQSSDTLKDLLDIPMGSYRDFFWGKAKSAINFWGNDMGYARLLYMFGVVGTFFFFLYMFVIVYSSFTKDKGSNLLIVTVLVYSMLLNIKGFTDLNSILYLFFFFFMFYKYYVYYPQLYLSKLIEKGNNKIYTQ